MRSLSVSHEIPGWVGASVGARSYEKGLNASALLSLVLAGAPESQPTPPPTVEARPDSTHVLTYDSDGEVVAELVAARTDTGGIHLDARFPDGASVNVEISAAALASGDVGEALVECVDCESANAQLAGVQDVLNDVDHQAGWVPCAIHSTMAIVEVAHANPWAVVSAVLAACSCLPELVEEFENIKCPGY
jgi:hypothetical protein